ncbi:MAG TPA: hypothetical protein DEG28_04445 [Porphyromonadaceae bacterium]|nr:hypothetical protein [Porphyromonadaceae bacterium]
MYLLVTTQKCIIFAISNQFRQGNPGLLILSKQMNRTKKRFFSLIAFLTITIVLFAQEVGSNSPYGRYGYGLLSNPSFGASEAMGGIRYGLRRSQQVNPGNPASYSEIDTLTFIFDLGVSGQMTRLGDGSNIRDYYNGNLDYIAMQFPVFKNVGVSVGLLPFSKVGYNYGATRSRESIQYQETYRGTGGLSQVYGGIAWEPFKNISVGANISYLFGNITYSTVGIPTSTSALISESKQTYSIHHLKYDLGVQYTYPIDRTSSVTLGAVYTPQVSPSAVVYPTEMLYTADPYKYPYSSPAQIQKTDTAAAQTFEIPQSFGLGATYMNAHLLVGIDGTYQLWKDASYPSLLDGMTDASRFNNRYRINAGAEYIIDPLSRNFFQRIRFRGGVSYSNSYINVNVKDPATNTSLGVGGYKEYGINFGLGLPFRDNLSGRVSMLNIGFGYSRQQPEKSNMIKQDMFKISVNMNINELWFFKRQFN